MKEDIVPQKIEKLTAPAEARERERRKTRERTEQRKPSSNSCGALSYINLESSTPTDAVSGAHLAPLAPLTRAAHVYGAARCSRVWMKVQ